MESVFNFNMNQLLAFGLVLLRMIGFVVAMPIVGTGSVPASVKVLLAMTLSTLLFPQIVWTGMNGSIEQLNIITLAVKELFVGLSFGFLARMFFIIITMMGEVISISLGISAAQLFNPTMGESSTAVDQLYVTLASIFFFSIGGHHVLISGIYQSFAIVSVEQLTVQLTAFQSMGTTVQEIMASAVKMSAPVMVTILFTNVAIGVIGRAVPQINILITSLPVNILVGLGVMFVSLPLLIFEMTDVLNLTATELFRFIKSF
jgi:flagellar biosynthetic protein FliR